MSRHKILNGLADSTFDAVLTRLIDDPKFRQVFFDDPRIAAEELGIHITPEQLATLMDVAQSKIKGGNVSFDEGLVLCSSSGY